MFNKKGVVDMKNLIKKQIIELASELKKYAYADQEAICWNGSLLDLANYDLSIEYYTRNIYGNYSADVAATKIFMTSIFLILLNTFRRRWRKWRILNITKLNLMVNSILDKVKMTIQ